MIAPALHRRVAMQLIAFALATACSACTVGPDPRRPEVAVPDQWSAVGGRAFEPGLASRAVGQPFDGRRWWAVFADPALDRLVEAAIEQNLDVQTAGLRIAAARAQRDAVAGGRYPNVDASGIGARSRMSENGIARALGGNRSGGSSGGSGGSGNSSGGSPPSTFNFFQAGFDATWELDFFGRVKRSVQAADADIRAAEEARHDSLVSLTAEVARSFLSLRGSERERAIAVNDIATQEHLQQLVASLNRSGLVASADVVAQRAQLAAARAQLPPLDQAIAQAMNQLALLLALSPGSIDKMLDQPAPLALPPEVPVGLPGDLLRRRPDIRQREAELESATARIGVATSALFPSVRLGLVGGLQATRSADLLDWASRFFLGGAQLSIPIFEGGRVRAQVRIADLQARQAVLAYRQTVLTAFHDVDNALVAYAEEQRRASALQQQLADANRSRELALERYQSGLAAYIEVLSAERQAHQAELSVAASNVVVSTDLVALFKALGGGWDEAEAVAR